MAKKYWKSQGKVREFCQSGKVGTLFRSSVFTFSDANMFKVPNTMQIRR